MWFQRMHLWEKVGIVIIVCNYQSRIIDQYSVFFRVEEALFVIIIYVTASQLSLLSPQRI